VLGAGAAVNAVGAGMYWWGSRATAKAS